MMLRTTRSRSTRRDEEIGTGVELLGFDRLGADGAYTIDGGAAGKLEGETFSALEAKVVSRTSPSTRAPRRDGS